MIGMLIGAWLLMHQCCAIGEKDTKSRNSYLIEQLSRRSNLEKNFMRFGRSSGISFHPEEDVEPELFPTEVKRVRDSSNYFRLGRARGIKDNFIRFGKRDNQTLKKLLDISMRFSHPSEGENINRAEIENDDLTRFNSEPDMQGADNLDRPIRAKTDFIRFGRNYNEPNARSVDIKALASDSNEQEIQKKGRSYENLKLRFGRDAGGKDSARDRRGKTDFMRFGRDSNDRDKPSYSLSDEVNAELMRFCDEFDEQEKPSTNPTVMSNEDSNSPGEEFNELNKQEICRRANLDLVRVGRSNRPVLRSERGRALDAHFIRFGRSLPSPFQPGFIIGPELSLLPPLYFKQPNENAANNMLRLG